MPQLAYSLTNLDENIFDVLRALGRGFHVDQPVVLRILPRLFGLYLPASTQVWRVCVLSY